MCYGQKMALGGFCWLVFAFGDIFLIFFTIWEVLTKFVNEKYHQDISAIFSRLKQRQITLKMKQMIFLMSTLALNGNLGGFWGILGVFDEAYKK